MAVRRTNHGLGWVRGWAARTVVVVVATWACCPAPAADAFPAEDPDFSPWLTVDPKPSPFFTAIGSATSQGVSVLKADQARSIFGVTGAGVKLGVISDSFNGSGSTPTPATQIAAGNLPGSGNPNGYTTGVTVVKDDTGTDEGRAMLEIVHDVAPGAQLHFHSAFNNTNPSTDWTGVGTPTPDRSIADAIDGLAGVTGMRVIVDDVGYLTAPRFQDGAAAQAANAAFARGIAYFSAAGNSATDATRVTTSVGVSGTVNWGTDGLLLMRVSPNSTGRAVLQWGEPYTSVTGSAATSNFSVAVTTTNGATTYFTIDGQAAGQDPYEFIGVSNSGTAAVNFALRVTRLSGTAPVVMQLSTFGSTMSITDADKNNAPTVYGQAAATGAVGVAASYWGTPATVESFSSRGPTLILVDAAGNPVNETRTTPLLTAPDGGTTTTSGFNPFYGTSAAAPHAAAVAALVLERFDQKGITVSTRDLYQVLYDSAVDIGTAGLDTASGYGRIDALAAVGAGRIWDGNGSTAGVAGSGTWSRANWTLEEAGDKPTGKFIRGQQAVFGSGTGVPATYSILVDGTYDVAGLRFTRDTVTLSSGSGALRLTAPTVEVASGLTATVAAALTGTAGLQKTGAGTLTITGSTGYTGGTTVSAGSLVVNGNIAAGGPTSLAVGATLAGSGTAGAVTVGTGATIAPGNSPGTLTTGDVIFGAGGNYNWQLLNATGSAGTAWDFIAGSGSLSINATSGNPFAINLWTLSGTGPDVSGPAANFDQASSYAWRIGTFAGGITGFAADRFSLVTGSANGTGGFTNPFFGMFSIDTLGNDLRLVYTAPTLQSFDYVGGTGSFSTSANWAGGASPTGYGTVTFSGPGGTATNDRLSLVGGLTFSGSATGGYVVTGSALSVHGAGVVNDSSFAQVIQAGLTLAASSTVSASAASLALLGGLDNGGFGVTVAGAADTTISALAGAGRLVKNGAGTLTLSGSGSFTGGTTINAGRVVAGAATALGSGSAALAVNGGTLDTGSTGLVVGTLSGSSGAVITTGSAAGTRTLTTTVASGTSTFAGRLQDNGAGLLALTKSGAGTLVLSGSNSATGGVTVAAGTLLAGHAAAFGGASTPLAITSGTVNTGTFSVVVGALSGSSGAVITTATNAGTRSLTTTVGSGTSTFAGTLANSGSGVLALTKAGAGTLVLAGSNSHSGTTTISAGTLQVGAGGTTGLLGGGAVTIASGAALSFNRGDSYGGAVSSQIAGAGAVTLAGGTLTLSGSNTHSGGTTIAAGTLLVGNTFALGGTSVPLAVNGGTLNLQTFSVAVGTLSGSAGAVITTVPTAGTRTLTTTVASGSSSTYAGTIASNGVGAIALTKAGAGTLTLAGSNAYTGQTTVSAGTLAFAGDNSLGANLVGNAGAVVTFGTARLTIGNPGSNSVGTYSGSLVGTGTVALRGGNATIVNADGTGGANTNYQIFATGTALAPAAFGLDTGGSTGDRKDFGYVNDTGTTLQLSSLSGFGAIRGDSGGSGTTTRFITVNQSGDTTFSGALVSHRSSAGVVRAVTFEKQGAGSLTLAGFIGKQTVTSQVGDAPVNLVANGGLLAVTSAANTTTSNSDAIRLGTVTITSGTLAFSSQALLNTAGSAGASAIRMDGGTLRWNAGTTQDLTAGGRLTLVAGRDARFDTNGNAVTLTSPLAGGTVAAAVAKVGAGLLSIDAANTYTGATTVAGGTLRIGGAGSLGAGAYAGAIVNDAAFVHASSADQTLSGTISGGGSILKTGAGTLVLTAVSPFSGAVTIGAGALRMDGALAASTTTVETSGALTGSGTVGSVMVHAGGALRPGSGVGRLAAGAVTFGAGGVYDWQLAGVTGSAGAQWDFLDASGSLTVAATVGSPFAINLRTLSDTGPDVSGPVAGFNQYASASWTIGSFAGGITGFAPELFSIVTGSANGTGGFANPFFGTFSIAAVGNDLAVVYSAPALASYEYTGGTGSFGDPTNWLLGAVPAGASTILFSGSGGTATNDLLPAVTGIAFTVSAGGYLVTGSGLAVGSGGVTTDSAVAQTITAPLALTAAAGVTANSGGLALADVDTGGFGLTVAGAADTTIAALGGAGGLEKSGNGTLRLSGSNSFAGGVAIAGGTLALGHALALGGTANPLSIAAGTLDTGTTSPLMGALSGSAGSVITTATTAGTRTLTTNVASGSTVYAGTVRDNGAGKLAVTKSGGGTLLLSGSNGFSGGVAIAGGTLALGHALALGGTANPLSIAAGTLDTDTFSPTVAALSGSAGSVITTATTAGTRTFTTNVASGSTVYAGTIRDNGAGKLAVTKGGAGTLVLSGSSGFTGATTITGGTLQVGDGGMTGRLGTGPITNHGALVFNRTDGYGGAVANVISGSGRLTVAGGTLALSAANAFTGDTRVTSGVLSLAHGQALAQSTLDMNAVDSGSVSFGMPGLQTYTLGGLAGSRNLALGGNGLTLGGNNRSTTYSGVLSGSGALVKIGSGTFTMSGSSAATGPITVSGGRLVGTTASLRGMITNSTTVEFAQTVNGTFVGRITSAGPGTGQTVKSGSGTLSLSGTISGGTVSVTGGRLVLSASNAQGVGIVNAATVEFAQATSGTFVGSLNGSGAVVKTGAGTLTVQGASVTGTTTVSAGRLVASASTIRGRIVNDAAFEFAQATNGEYTSLLSGSGSLTKSGSGTLTLSGSSLVTGSTSVTGGILATAGAERLLDTGTIGISAGATLRLGGNETVAAVVGSGSVNLQSFRLTVAGSGSTWYAGNIFGSGGLTKAGVGVLTLTGSNSFLGGTNLAAGTLVLSSTGALSPFTTLSIAAGSTLVVNRDVRVFAYTNAGGTISGTGRLLTSATATTGGTLTSLADVSGTDAFAVGLLKTSTDTLVVSGSTSFTGGVVVEQGTVRLDAGGSFAATNVVEVRSGATLDLNGQSQTVAALAGSGSVALGGGTLTVAATTSTAFAGGLAGGALVKSGSSVLNLTGSASVTTAVVNAGLMAVNGVLSGTVTVAPGGVLGGAGTIVGDVTVGGIHAPGNSPDVSTISGNLAYDAGATVLWELGANSEIQGTVGSRVFDQILAGGNLTFSGSTTLVLSFFDQDPDSTWTSTVDWGDEFWSANRAWKIYEVTGTTSGFVSNLSLRTESWLDSNGVSFTAARANHTFSLALAGDDVMLVYAVPEPSTLALVAVAGLCGLVIRRGRRSP